MKHLFRLRFLLLFLILSGVLIGLMEWTLFSKPVTKPSEAKNAIAYLDKDYNLEPYGLALSGEEQANIEPAAAASVVIDHFAQPPSQAKEDNAVINSLVDTFSRDTKEAKKTNIESKNIFNITPDTLTQEKSIKYSNKIEYQSPVRDFKAAKIAIIIDDIGMNIPGSHQALNLKGPITAAILPYAPKAREFAAQAQSNGHEIIIHTPMEAMSSDVNLGPMALRASYGAQEFSDVFQEILNSFDGYVGINNHMGSRLTQDERAMRQLMRLLKQHDLFFVDSKTIHTSIAGDTASAFGVPYAVRDVFLDHEETQDFVLNALAKTERIARETGHAIAIAHPKAVTLDVLEQWIPDAQSRGITLVPVSELLNKPVSESGTILNVGLSPEGEPHQERNDQP